MDDRDPSLDLALRLLGDASSPDAGDEAAFAKRVAARLGAARPKRSELEPLLAAPFPDDQPGDVAEELGADDVDTPPRMEAAEGAAAAEYAGEERGWEGSISRPPDLYDAPASAPRSALEGSLARLARGANLAADETGKASGDDSGLIDLRGLGKPANDPPAAQPAPASKPDPLAATAPQAPIAKAKKVPAREAVFEKPTTGPVPTSAMPATAPPSTTAAAVASRGAPPPSTTKTSRGNGLWIALGGLAAAAAFGIYALAGPMNKSAAPDAKEAAREESAAKKKAADTTSPPEVVASAEPTPTPAAPAPSASVINDDAPPASDTTASPNPPATIAVVAKTPAPMKPTSVPTTTATTTAAPTATASASTAPVASTTTATTGKGPTSLDDALGLNKPAPTATTTAPPVDLPDKPDQGDIRSAVNGKLGAANGCVKGLDGPSAVTITFSPSGAVSGVVVSSGPAKGTGAEACIKSVFSGAHVPRSKLGGYGYAQLNP